MGGVGTVYPAESWAPRGRAHDFYQRGSYCKRRYSQSRDVCPSVRLSVQYSLILYKKQRYIVMISSLTESPKTLTKLLLYCVLTEIRNGSPLAKTSNETDAWDMNELALFDF